MVSAELEYDANPDRLEGVAWAMQESWTGILVAGAIFSLVYLMGVVSIGIASGMMSIAGIILIFIMFFVFPVVGLLVTIFWSIFAFVFVMVLNLTVGGLLNRRTAVGMFGGATGFFATYWQIFDWSKLEYTAGVCCLVGVGLALLFCQAGALFWARKRNVFYEPNKVKAGPRYQFGIKQMFAMTVLFGLLFAANQFVPRHEVLVMAGIYTVLQLLGLALDRSVMFLRTGSVVAAGG